MVMLLATRPLSLNDANQVVGHGIARAAPRRRRGANFHI
jgi:hypothetical protein